MEDCRADPARVAPLVRALLAAEDPETGKRLSDQEICDELIIFIFAGHDTTATTLTYALWALGRNADLQDRVAAEVAALPDRPLTPDDLPFLTLWQSNLLNYNTIDRYLGPFTPPFQVCGEEMMMITSPGL